MEIIHKEQTIIFTVDYGKRKAMELVMDTAGMLKVKAPKGTSEEDLKAFMAKKADWVIKQQAALERTLKAISSGPQKVERTYETGEKFLYLGKQYPIVIHVDEALEKGQVVFTGTTLDLYVRSSVEGESAEHLKTLMTRHCMKACKTLINERLAVYSKQLGLKPKSVSIEDSPVKWGSCDTNRHLMFNWRLIMASVELVDYIVVHELCHLEHMNHSRSFWRLVGSVMPDYEVRQNALNLLNAHMVL